MKKMLIFISFLCNIAVAQTTLSGSIGGMTLKASKNPWVITGDIFIEEDSKAIIEKGCIFLFKPFTGFSIYGSLFVEGKKDDPVIFTSINDTSYNKATDKTPGPFEWNGITIYEKAHKNSLSNFILSYSVYGIRSKTYNIILYKALFRDNGQFNFTINDKIIPANNNIPFSYNGYNVISDFPPVIVGDDSKSDYLFKGTLAVGSALLISTGYFSYKYLKISEKYDNALYTKDINYYYEKKRETSRIVLTTGIIGGAATAIGLKFLFFDQLLKKKENINLSYNNKGINIELLF